MMSVIIINTDIFFVFYIIFKDSKGILIRRE